MRAVCRVIVLVLVVVVPSVMATAKHAGPVVLHLRWQLVTTEPGYVAADDRYVAIVKDRYPAVSELTLIDQQTHTRRDLSAPGCSGPLYPSFDSPWLVVTCVYGSYRFYSLAGRRWSSFVVSPQCQGACEVVGVGRDWAKITSDEGPCYEHCANNYFLQSLATGVFRPDPVTPGGKTFDDLNVPSGSRRLCSPLRYPRSFNGAAQRWEPGSLVFDGQFALASGDVLTPDAGGAVFHRLERCGSQLNDVIPSATPVLASSSVVIGTPSSGQLAGRFLPTLQRFSARLPCTCAVASAISTRTIYARDALGSILWAAALPPLKVTARR